jgi:hypothetical protein
VNIGYDGQMFLLWQLGLCETFQGEIGVASIS